MRLKSYTELLCSEKGFAINITQKVNIVGNIINIININLLEKNLTQTTKLAHGVVGYKVWKCLLLSAREFSWQNWQRSTCFCLPVLEFKAWATMPDLLFMCLFPSLPVFMVWEHKLLKHMMNCLLRELHLWVNFVPCFKRFMAITCGLLRTPRLLDFKLFFGQPLLLIFMYQCIWSLKCLPQN